MVYLAPGGYIRLNIPDVWTSVGLHSVHIVGYVSNEDLAANAATTGAPPGAGGGYFIIRSTAISPAGNQRLTPGYARIAVIAKTQ
jgi:hypothetical protein